MLGSLVTGLSPRRTRFNTRLFLVGFVTGYVALGQNFLRAFRFNFLTIRSPHLSLNKLCLYEVHCRLLHRQPIKHLVPSHSHNNNSIKFLFINVET
jgi:hypothetical protein